MLSKVISAAILFLAVGDALAAPQASATLLPSPAVCTVPSYGPFKLFARRVVSTSTVDYPVRLLRDPSSKVAISHMIVDTNATCTDCGVTPSYWLLDNMSLYAASPSFGTAAVKTVNQQVVAGSQLPFITSSAVQPSYPIYCSVTTGTVTPPVLSVHGTSKKFTMCAFTSVYPPATLFSIVYDRSLIQPVGESCYPVDLILQSIGIIPTK